MSTTKDNLQIEKFNEKTMNFKRWLQQLKGAFTLMKTPDTEKVPLLLHYIGTHAFSTLCDYMNDEDLYTKTFEEIEKKLKELYTPEGIEIAEIYKFNGRKQLQGESVQAFLTNLKKLSQTCNFSTYLQKALRNHLCVVSNVRELDKGYLKLKI